MDLELRLLDSLAESSDYAWENIARAGEKFKDALTATMEPVSLVREKENLCLSQNNGRRQAEYEQWRRHFEKSS